MDLTSLYKNKTFLHSKAYLPVKCKKPGFGTYMYHIWVGKKQTVFSDSVKNRSFNVDCPQ